MALRDFVLHNFRWKFTALLLAMLLWFVIKFAIYREITGGSNQVVKHQPVMVLKAPDDPRLFRIDPPHVDLVVQAKKVLGSEDLQACVDLTRMPDVNTAFKEVLVRAGEGTKVVRSDPPYIMVERISLGDLSATNHPTKP